jgi:pilus assembly protein Flp/PilA
MLALFAWLETAREKRDEKGATAIEYGLLAALIAIAFILGATALGGALDALFNQVAGLL